MPYLFIVVVIIRKHRGHKDYNTLLIHTSHLTVNADYLATKVDLFIKELQEFIPSNSGGYFERILKIFDSIKINSTNKLFKEYFNRDFIYPSKISKEDVLDVITSKMNKDHKYIYAPFDVVSYHSSKAQTLTHMNRDLNYKLKDSNGEKDLLLYCNWCNSYRED